MSKNRKKKNFLIYPRFQLLMVALQISILVPGFGLIKLLIMKFFKDLTKLGLSAQLPLNHPYFTFIQNSENLLNTKIYFVFLAITILIILFSFILSHRLAGPVCRLKSYFKDLNATGKIKPLTFRKNDFFSELPHEINLALTKFNDEPPAIIITHTDESDSNDT